MVANGGADSLNGVPDVSLTTTGLTVQVISANMSSAALNNANAQVVPTPDGGVKLDFSSLSSLVGTVAVTQISGQVTLSIANFVSLSGDFIFQSSGTGFTVAADNVDAVLGTSAVNLSVTGASFGLIVVPGTGGASSNYALVASGGMDSLNGIPDLTLTTNGLMVEVNNGVASPPSITTPDGTVLALRATQGITQVVGSVSLAIGASSSPFISLSGESLLHGTAGSPSFPQVEDILVGASKVSAFVGAGTPGRAASALKSPTPELVW